MARILIVDDEAGLRRVLGRHFRRQGHQVTEVEDFTAVREEIDARHFDIAFLDICMPRMNGPDVCAALRIAQKPDGFELVNPPPIVLMTGHPDLLSIDFIKRLGGRINCCLIKPFSLEEADEVLECCLVSEALAPMELVARSCEAVSCELR